MATSQGTPPKSMPRKLPKMDVPAQEDMRKRLVAAYFALMQQMNAEIVATVADFDPKAKG